MDSNDKFSSFRFIKASLLSGLIATCFINAVAATSGQEEEPKSSPTLSHFSSCTNSSSSNSSSSSFSSSSSSSLSSSTSLFTTGELEDPALLQAHQRVARFIQLVVPNKEKFKKYRKECEQALFGAHSIISTSPLILTPEKSQVITLGMAKGESYILEAPHITFAKGVYHFFPPKDKTGMLIVNSESDIVMTDADIEGTFFLYTKGEVRSKPITPIINLPQNIAYTFRTVTANEEV